MDKEHVKSTLRAHAPELKEAGIIRLHLHGFDRSKVKSSLTEVSLARQLSAMPGADVDLANERTLKQDVRVNFDLEAELFFRKSYGQYDFEEFRSNGGAKPAENQRSGNPGRNRGGNVVPRT